EAVNSVEKLSSWDPKNVRLKKQLAEAMTQLGGVLLHLASPEGQKVQSRVVALREEVLKADPKNPRRLADLGVALTNLGAHHLRLHQYADAIPCYRRADELFGQIDPTEKVDNKTVGSARKRLIEFIALCEAAPAVLEDPKLLRAQPLARRVDLLAWRA